MRDVRGGFARPGAPARRTLGAFLVLALLALGGIASTVSSTPARAEIAPALSATTATCGGEVGEAVPERRQINLVIDDSGSMFDPPDPKRWSYAHYALQVFAAMLDENDSLSVYRLSDFRSGDSGPVLVLDGASSASSRVGAVLGMKMQGYGTPYRPVQRAYEDLRSSQAAAKWLVVLTDGQWDDGRVPISTVQSNFESWVDANRTETSSLKVAYLAVGSGAASIANEPERGIFAESTASSAEVITRLNGFANRIFQRSEISLTAQQAIVPDITLDQVLVFAQGADVTVGDIETEIDAVAPNAVVDVRYNAANGDAMSAGRPVPAQPDTGLVGKLAFYPAVPAGDSVIDIAGAQDVHVTYKPRVAFGAELVNADGEIVDADKIVGGTYTLNYGFMDEQCHLIQSDLLGKVEYTASISHDGELVEERFQSGDSIELERGDVEIEAHATYLAGFTASATLRLKVLRPARPGVIEAKPSSFDVSKLGSYAAPDGAIELKYLAGESGAASEFTAEEWATMTSESFTVESDSNEEWQVVVSDKPGTVYLVPLAHENDVLHATTGEIELTVKAAHTYDEQLNEASATITTTIVDDIPPLSRILDWFLTDGWKWLLVAIGIAVICGYLFKRRFSRRFRRRPVITATSLVDYRKITGRGTLEKSLVRRLLPFIADTATLTYAFSAPGAKKFPRFRLRATAGGAAILLNAPEIAKRAERTASTVQVNGQPLDPESRRQPRIGSSTAVLASDNVAWRFEMSPDAGDGKGNRR